MAADTAALPGIDADVEAAMSDRLDAEDAWCEAQWQAWEGTQ